MIHSGGSTSVEAIMTSEDYEEVENIVTNSELIDKIKNGTPKCYKPFDLELKEFYLYEKGRINMTMISKYIKFGIKNILAKLHLRRPFILEIEDSVETDIKAYYLILFDQMFLQNKAN